MSFNSARDPENAIDAQASVELSSEKIAVVFFEVVRNRLQHVNSWPIIAKEMSASFQLANREGIEVYRKVQDGDFVKIDIDSIHGRAARSVNWVRIDEVFGALDDEGVDSYGFVLRTSENPTAARRIQHYGSNEIIGRCVVTRRDTKVSALISGADGPGRLLEDARTNGPSVRLAHVNWQKLVEGLLSR